MEMTRQLENSSGLEPFLAKVIKASAVSRAARLCLDFDVIERLALTGNQTDLFVGFLAAAIVRQAGQDESYLARHPAVNAARQVPLLGWVLDFFVFDWDDANQTVEQELVTEASARLTQVRQKAIGVGVSGLDFVAGLDVSGTVTEYVDGLITREINPAGLQRAANLTASTYTNFKHRPEALRPAMERTLSGISVNQKK